jgi:hypothetical protein
MVTDGVRRYSLFIRYQIASLLRKCGKAEDGEWNLFGYHYM